VLEKFLTDHVGHQAAVTENTLADMLGMSESTLRSEIARLRDEGVPIQNFRDGDGYFVPANESEFREQIGKWNEEIRKKRKRIENHIEAWEEFDQEEIELSDGGQDIIEPEYECRECGGNVPQTDAKYPKSGEMDGPLCSGCYGRWLMSK